MDTYLMDIQFFNEEKYEEYINTFKEKNNILEMLFSLMETNVIFGYTYKSDLDILISELRLNESIWNEKIAPIFNISYKDACLQIRKTRINNLSREDYNKITNIINKAEFEYSQLLESLGKLHAYKTINDNDIMLNYFNMRALTYHIYNREKENQGLKPTLIIEDKEECQNSNITRFGVHSIVINGRTVRESIQINVGNILKYYNNKEECIYELIDSIYHEIKHSQIFNLTRSYNVFDTDVLHAALDSVIHYFGKGKYMKNHENYYYDNYLHNKEELMARIYGRENAIKVMQLYKKNIDQTFINRKRADLERESALFNIKSSKEKITNKDSFLISNMLSDKVILENKDIIEIKSILSHIYYRNGKRKGVDVLFNQRAIIVEQFERALDRIYKSDIPTGEKITRYKVASNEIKVVKSFYDEIIYFAFNKVNYEDFKNIMYLHKKIRQSLQNVLLNRETRIVNNDDAYNNCIIGFKDWSINNNNIMDEYNIIQREIKKLDHYLNTITIEKRYTR